VLGHLDGTYTQPTLDRRLVMVNSILPVDPDNNQLRKFRLIIKNQITTIEKLADLSFDMFEELRKSEPNSRLLVKWRWVVNDLL
jgi:hypothetical protein